MQDPPDGKRTAMAVAVLVAVWVTAALARQGVPLPAPATPARAAAPKPIVLQAGPAPAQAAASGQVQEVRGITLAAAQAGSTYVGDETCIGCHEDQQQGYSNTMHGRPDHARSPAASQGCETCHGPGSKHVDDPEIAGSIILLSGKQDPRDTNQLCLSCHERGTHALWEGSVHDARKLSCTTCHSVHAFKSETAQLKTVRELDTCATCHREKIAKLDRSGHMPLREGKMECSTCHNPHGSTNVRQLRRGDSIAELCTSCHAEKRGPFLWEHASTRDGCVTCHDPHGSSNERMLVSKPPILCQRCHVHTRHPSTIYDGNLIGSGGSPSARVYTRSCVTCHSAIHGSNHPSGQRFTR